MKSANQYGWWVVCCPEILPIRRMKVLRSSAEGYAPLHSAEHNSPFVLATSWGVSVPRLYSFWHISMAEVFLNDLSHKLISSIYKRILVVKSSHNALFIREVYPQKPFSYDSNLQALINMYSHIQHVTKGSRLLIPLLWHLKQLTAVVLGVRPHGVLYKKQRHY